MQGKSTPNTDDAHVISLACLPVAMRGRFSHGLSSNLTEKSLNMLMAFQHVETECVCERRIYIALMYDIFNCFHGRHRGESSDTQILKWINELLIK